MKAAFDNGLEEEELTVKIRSVTKDGVKRQVSETWAKKDGSLHNEFGPAKRIWNRNTGVLTDQKFYLDGKLHRLDGPALTEYDEKTGVLVREIWLLDGKEHRFGDKPAHIHVEPKTGIITYEAYLVADLPHREIGPAIIERDPMTGDVISKEYFREGREMKSDHQESPRP